jgi:oxalate decarboxylase/phosphoglucose isomerase-like protein (cupin superfamily)
MTQPAFPKPALAILDAAYPETSVKLSHAIVDQPLLTLASLVELGAALPPESVEYNPGNLPIGIKAEDVPSPRLSITETIRSIEENGSWMVLKRIEQHPAYAALLAETLAEITPMVRAKTGAMLGTEGFIFISSPGAVTPFHFDPEHNILMQIAGQKVMHVFPAADEAIVSPTAHEAFHLGQQHRNLPWQDDYAARGEAYALIPGDAIYVPVKSPHWVQNGNAVSISLSVTWRSEWSYQEADARAFNHHARKYGITPASPKRYPQSNKAKSLAFRVARKVGLTGR